MRNLLDGPWINLEGFDSGLGPKWKPYIESILKRTKIEFKNTITSLKMRSSSENTRLASYYTSLNEIIDLRLSGVPT
jgi:hypothetical protein